MALGSLRVYKESFIKHVIQNELTEMTFPFQFSVYVIEGGIVGAQGCSCYPDSFPAQGRDSHR